MILFFFILFLNSGHAARVIVPAGTYTPLFKDKGETSIKVSPLWVDTTPVTNEEFLKFVMAHPRWMRGAVSSLMADKTYLQKWTAPLAFPPAIAKFPVVNVSWFAARAYCKQAGGRLPTIVEWEYFSDSSNSEEEAKALQWYAKGNDALKAVAQSAPNKFGLHDTSGLIWEWVEDFASAILASDSRDNLKRDMFCGGASLNSKDPKLYATFMRYALRSSLKAQYTTSALGFRCVKEME